MDAWLVLVTLIWGANYSVMKRGFVEMPPMAFNAVRFAVASALFAGAIVVVRRNASSRSSHEPTVFYTPHPVDRRDWWDIVWLGLVGHFGYQLLWATGLETTSVSNAALIIGTAPFFVALLSAVTKGERIGRFYWAGLAVSAVGLYFVVGGGASFSAASLRGDGLVAISSFCWAAYTVGGARIMARHSPLFVTGATMAVGSSLYLLTALPAIRSVDWTRLDPVVWPLLAFASVGAGCVAYIIWYAAVQSIGAARTAVYSNVIPIVAMVIAAVWLGEALTLQKVIGAAAVLGGVFLTRLSR